MHTRPTALMKDVVSVLFLFFLVLTGIPHMSRDVFAQEPIELESDSFSLHVSANGLVAGLVDHVTGTNYINRESPSSFAVLKGASRACYSKAARYDGKQLVIDFEEPAGQVAFTVTAERRRLVFEVVSLTWSDAEELVFAGMPLALKGDLAEPFGVSPLALNLQTNCHTIPGLNSSLSGFMAYRHFGIVGARGAIIACPVNEMRDALKEAVKSSPGLVCSSLGGPWALDAEINQGSYLIASEEDVTEANVDKWIDAARQAGATQIDLHGGHPFRWGDYEVNREVYPRGRDSLKAVADAIHEAGLCVGLHSYAFFIAKETPWVTPVPDPRLDYDATFTLAGDLSDTDAVIPVMESTEAMSTVTGFQVRNSVTLWIDDELILYADIGKDSPYEFRQCIRGAHGTRPAAHAKNAPIRHLKECFGLFVPRGDSTLYTEVAQRTAELYNYCGFDMLYLDALDGAGILAGGGNAWHYEAKFVHELMNRLDRPPVMEMSTFSHHLWCARSRMQAWDCPSRAVKDLVDCHVLGNLQWKAAFLPTHLGWWGNFGWDGIHPERTMPDDMEYLCAKALATDSSLSYIVGFGPESLKHETVQRLAGIARRYEKLRLAGAVPDSVKERLAARGAEFTLSAEGDEPCRFREVVYAAHVVAAGGDPEEWSVHNPYETQPMAVRIEALLAVNEADDSASVLLTDWSDIESFERTTQEGVVGTLNATDEARAAGEPAAVLVAQNNSVEPDRAWASFTREFETPMELKHKGLGVWVKGDGQGAVLNLQLRSPQHLGGGFADRYIALDFEGWRHFALVEAESHALSRYEWGHTRRWKDLTADPNAITPFAYPMYNTWPDYWNIAFLTVGINNLPVGKSVQAGLGPICALPLGRATLINPAVTINGETLTFPVKLESGSYMEFRSKKDCKVYNANGDCLGDVIPTGDVPLIRSGDNTCVFKCASDEQERPRAKYTIVFSGNEL